jgi:hypothetical protein
MDLEKYLAVSLLMHLGVAVWVTSGERQTKPVVGNVFLFFVTFCFVAFVMNILNVWSGRMFRYLVAALAALIIGFVTTKKPKNHLEFMLQSFAIGPAAGLIVLFVLMMANASVDVFKNAMLVCATLNNLAVVVFLAALPDRASLGRFLAAFAIPGLGHVLMGKTKKGLFFFGAIVAIYLTGLAITSFRMVGREDNPFYWYGQFFSGFTTVVGLLLPSGKAHLPEGWSYTHFDPGLLYVCAAGLLNYVVALNVFQFKDPPKEEPPKAEGAPPA